MNNKSNRNSLFALKKTHMKQTKSGWGAPIHSRKCILETIKTLELGKHLLARGESDGN
jgi:hypothetical protein